VYDKTFREERSVNNHIRSKHVHEQLLNTASDDNNHKHKKRKSNTNYCDDTQQDNQQQQQPFMCEYCNAKKPSSTHSSSLRISDSLQALNDHIRAKYEAIHTSIKPDWIMMNSNGNGSTTDKAKDDETKHARDYYGECSICGLVYGNESGREKLLTEFIPTTARHVHKIWKVSSMPVLFKSLSTEACSITAREFLQHSS
jgi:hypothetical protein